MMIATERFCDQDFADEDHSSFLSFSLQQYFEHVNIIAIFVVHINNEELLNSIHNEKHVTQKSDDRENPRTDL